MTLRSLPPELVNAILSFYDTAHLSMQLWLAGDKALQQLLENSVQIVELRSEEELAVCKIPTFLSHFGALRHLILDRMGLNGYLRVYDREQSFRVIQSLPKLLETLCLRYVGSADLFFPADPTTTPYISLKEAFPQLVRVQLSEDFVWTPSSLKQLPDSITDLVCVTLPSTAPELVEALDALPHSLVKLGIKTDLPSPLYAVPFLLRLPPNLTAMAIATTVPSPEEQLSGLGFTEHDCAKLPRSLTTFHSSARRLRLEGLDILYHPLNRNSPFFMVKWRLPVWSAIPPFMSHVITYPDEAEPKAPQATIIEHIQAMPSHMEAITFTVGEHLTSEHIRALPRRLRTLRCFFGALKGLKQGDVPETLRELTIMNWKKAPSASKWACFPALTSLYLSHERVTYDVVSLIPRSITNLNLGLIRGQAADNVVLPPRLRYLRLNSLPAFTVFAEEGKKGKLKAMEPLHDLLSNPRPQPQRHLHALHTLRFAALPQTLSTLHLDRFPIPFSELVHLPQNLKSLDLDYVVDLDHSKDLIRSFIAKRRQLLNSGSSTVHGAGREALQASGFEDGLAPLDSDYQVSFVDFLPPNLTELRYNGHTGPFSVSSWSHFPTTLRHLSLWNGESAFPGQLLTVLPTGLKTVYLTVQAATEQELACIPKTLRKGRIALCQDLAEPLSLSTAQSIPIGLNIHYNGAHVSDALTTRVEIAKAAAAEGDYVKLQAVLEGRSE